MVAVLALAGAAVAVMLARAIAVIEGSGGEDGFVIDGDVEIVIRKVAME